MHLYNAMPDTYDVEGDVGLRSETLDDVQVSVAANDGLVHAELGLERLGLLGVADEDGDIELAALGVLKDLGEDSTADEAWRHNA